MRASVDLSQKVDYKIPSSSIGDILIGLNKIKSSDIERILAAQEKYQLRFGDAAIKLGLVMESDITQVMAMQFNYPFLQAGQGGLSKELTAAYKPFTEEGESLRALRSQLLLTWFNSTNKILAVVSATKDDGGSVLAANLAIVCSQLDAKTLLIDANLRDQNQRKLFNSTEKKGLSDILAGRVGEEVISPISSLKNLSLLNAGTETPNPQELLCSADFIDLLAKVSHEYDIVLIDSAPSKVSSVGAGVMSSDMQTIVSRAGGALVVSKLGHTSFADLNALNHQIQVTGAKIVAAVNYDF